MTLTEPEAIAALAKITTALETRYPKVPYLACVSYRQEMEPVTTYEPEPRPRAPLFGKVWVRGKFRFVTESVSTELAALEAMAVALGVPLERSSHENAG